MDLSKFHSLDIVLIAGLPASGKSQFAREHFRDTRRKRVNRKEIRRLLYEMTRFGEKWKEESFSEHDEFLVKHVERKIVEHLLQNNERLLVDNTSVTSSSRKNYVTIAKQMRKTIGIIFFRVPARVCLERNRKREDPVPEMIISNLSAALELPSKEEGFQEVLILE